MKCPLCKQECNKEDLNTFLDYADYLYSQLCVKTVKLANGELNESKRQDLMLLKMCCDSISKYVFQFDRSAYGYLATPQEEEQPND